MSSDGNLTESHFFVGTTRPGGGTTQLNGETKNHPYLTLTHSSHRLIMGFVKSFVDYSLAKSLDHNRF